MNNVPRNTRYAIRNTRHLSFVIPSYRRIVSPPAIRSTLPAVRYTQYDIRSTKYYVRNYQRNMQNKPNFRKSQMNLSIYNTTDYKNFIPLAGYKNKPNSNPNKPNLKKTKMNVNSLTIKVYRKKDNFIVRINKPNFQNSKNERKLNFNKGLQKKRFFHSPKNKPKTNPISSKAKMSLKSHHQPDNTCCIRKTRRII